MSTQAVARGAGESADLKRPAITPASTRNVWLGLSLLTLLALNLRGFGYFREPLASRLRDPMHPLWRPSGTIGLSLGVVAFLLFLFLWFYPLLKRWPRLAGPLSRAGWLELHIAAGLTVPLIAITHAGWRTGGLIGLAFWAMFIVFLSGVIGRYLYARIPRQRSGVALSRDEAAGERDRLIFEIVAKSGLSPNAVRDSLQLEAAPRRAFGNFGSMLQLVRDERRRRRALRRLEQQLVAAGLDRAQIDPIKRLARKETILEQQLRWLDATQRLFRYWHAAHQPIAILALIGVLAHVVVAIAMGAVGI